jgi:Holliday junction resolvasome RuvABC endonuclease subunit
MTHNHKKYFRIIGISPSMWGFGFALLEGNNVLVDWDAKITSKDKNARCLKEVDRLINLYAPDAMALFDYSAGSKRSLRVQRLNRCMIALAKKHRIKVELFTPEKVAQLFFPDGGGTKHDMAEVLAKRFSDEIGFRLPPKRAAWMNQDRRMDIFDAAALAVAFRRKRSEQRRQGGEAEDAR